MDVRDFSFDTVVDGDGILHLAGRPAAELVARYGTPLLVLLEDQIRANCREYMSRLETYPRSRAYYASKAFLSVGFCKLLEQEGMCLDVVSSGELYTAMQAGFPPERILMHGNAKSMDELNMALDYGVGRIVIDNHEEIERLAFLMGERERVQDVMLRVAPGVKPDTHRYVQTGQLDSKFGFNIEGGAAEEAVKRIMQVESLNLIGLHCHIGSQILNHQPFIETVRIMLEFYARMRAEHNAPLDEFNIGGGLGIKYKDADEPLSIAKHVTDVEDAVQAECKRLGIPEPVLCDEPGRSIIANAGVTLYTIESVKQIPGIRNYASVDGGMADNPRYALYESYHHAALAERMNDAADSTWCISGKCCETGDMLARDMKLPDPAPGDLLALFSTGAYTFSMAGNYNRVPRPAVILASERGHALLVRRETPADVCSLDEVPYWLN